VIDPGNTVLQKFYREIKFSSSNDIFVAAPANMLDLSMHLAQRSWSIWGTFKFSISPPIPSARIRGKKRLGWKDYQQ